MNKLTCFQKIDKNGTHVNFNKNIFFGNFVYALSESILYLICDGVCFLEDYYNTLWNWKSKSSKLNIDIDVYTMHCFNDDGCDQVYRIIIIILI